MKNKFFKFRNSQFELLGKSRIMGILNVTPDSFSDGNQYIDLHEAVAHAIDMLKNGADIIDIGGESTRPGAVAVSDKEELRRVIPVLKALKSKVPNAVISVDTTKSSVAKVALSEGADIINDISGLTYDIGIADLVAEHKAGLILMHTRGNPDNMLDLTDYSNLIPEITEFLSRASEVAISRGVDRENIILDPGIGFAKTHVQNLEIIKKIKIFEETGYPILVGPSRKSFIGAVLNQKNPENRIWGTGAVVAWLARENISFIRVHDVREMREIISLTESIIKISMES